MSYVFDTSSFRVLKSFYPSRFPSLWENIDKLIASGTLISVPEVFNELDSYVDVDVIRKWIKENKEIFFTPSNEELAVVAEILRVPHFQALISKKNILTGKPVADPFVIAAAKVKNACVVTEESNKPNAAKIPNVCAHFEVECINLETFMDQQRWTF